MAIVSAFPEHLNRKTPDTTEFPRFFNAYLVRPASKSAPPASKALELKATIESKNPCVPSLPTVLHAQSSEGS